jgi:hypothetical protein
MSKRVLIAGACTLALESPQIGKIILRRGRNTVCQKLISI